MSLKECYPILFPFDPTAEMAPGTTFNDALADQLIASSGFCGGGTYQSDSSRKIFSKLKKIYKCNYVQAYFHKHYMIK